MITSSTRLEGVGEVGIRRPFALSTDLEDPSARSLGNSEAPTVFPGAIAELIRTHEELVALEAEWDGLYQKSSPRNPFLSHAWTLACWSHQPSHSSPFVLTFRDSGRLVGVAPLCIDKRSGFRILRFIADDRSDYLGFLCAPEMKGLERAMLDRLMALNAQWDLALLRRLTGSYSSLGSVSLSADWRSHRTKWTSAPYCISPDDWEAFHKSGPGWLREMRRRSRRFLRDGHRAERLTGMEAARALDIVSEIEAHSWKARQGCMRLQPGPGRELLRQAFETLGSRGEMDLWLAFVDERPAAFRVDFVLPRCVWHYQCGYHEEFRRARAGSFLTYQSLERAFERGVREFDYLSGDEPYKLERTNASRDIHHVAIHLPSLRGWLAYGLVVAPRWHLRKVPVLRRIYDALRSVKRAVFAGASAIRRVAPAPKTASLKAPT